MCPTLSNKHFHVCESRGVLALGEAEEAGSWGERQECHLSSQLPHFQIRIKVSSAALLKVCPMNTEVGRKGSVGGVVFPQN